MVEENYKIAVGMIRIIMNIINSRHGDLLMPIDFASAGHKYIL